MADAEPTPGSSLECFKQTWAAMFVHELSHTFGAFDFGSPYGYGFVGATKIATDAGRSGSGKGTNGATPMSNADTWSLFSLGKMTPRSSFLFLQFSLKFSVQVFTVALILSLRQKSNLLPLSGRQVALCPSLLMSCETDGEG